MHRTEIDLCRIVACLGVMLSHACAEAYHLVSIHSAAFSWITMLSTVVRPVIPIFFMITGVLFLSREELDLRRFFTGHVLHLTYVFCFWSLLYAVLRAAQGSFGSGRDFLMAVVSGHYHMWFLPAMIMVYLFLPPVHAAIYGRKLDPRYLLGVFFFLFIVLANCNLTPDPAPILYRFTQNFSLDYLSYLGYAVWGWWLSRRAFSQKCLWIAPLVYLAAVLLETAGNLWYSGYKQLADGWLFSFFSLPNFVGGSAAFCFFLALREHRFRHPELLSALSGATLTVYMIHPMVLNGLKRLLPGVLNVEPVMGSLLIFAALTAVSFAAALVIRRIPVLRRFT